jgi:hypothetical protein
MWYVTGLMADFALSIGDAGSLDSSGRSRKSDFVIRKMTFVAGTGASRWNNIAVAESTALVVGVVVVVGGGHGDDDGGGGWFGLNCEKSIRLYINRGSFTTP